MSSLYENIAGLCTQRGITVYKLCTDLGMRNSVISDLKTGRKKGLNAETLSKIAGYFGVSVDCLLGSAPKEKTPAEGGISEEDIKIALFGGAGEITDAMWEEAKSFIAFIKEREQKKREP